MNREPIINSLLVQDLYKFPMSQMILHKFPSLRTKWKYKCRSKNVDLSPFADEIRKEINSMENLVYQKDELEYLRDIRFLKSDFVDFLRLYRPQPRDYVKVDIVDGQLSIEADGPWVQVTQFEIPILAIVSEVYTRNMYPNIDYTKAREILNKNTELVNKNYLKWSCFGTRRRFSAAWQDEVTAHYAKHMRGNLNGTSNVYLAKKYNLKPIGTMAHEIFMAMQALVRVMDSQKFALENWVQEYRGDLGIALSDIFGVDAFIKDFDLFFAKLFDGVRHDSGDPIVWGNKIVQMYKELKINPLNKTAIFTDGLTFEKAVEIKDYFNGMINTAFGIGTNSTNDMGPEYPALQQVMKMTHAGNIEAWGRCEMKPVIKVSDSSGKGMCEDKDYENYVVSSIKQKINS